MPATANSSGKTQQTEANNAAMPARVSGGALRPHPTGSCGLRSDLVDINAGRQALISRAVIWYEKASGS